MSTAGVASLLALPVAIPLAGAIAAPLLARVHRRLPLVVSIVAMLGSASVLLLIAAQVYAGHGRIVSHFFGNWGPVQARALGIAFAADPFGLAFALITAVLGALLLIYILSELGDLGARELGGLACLCQLLLAALIGSALTADTINLFVWFEVAALASYGLTAFFLERPIALEAAFKVLVLTSIAGFLVFIGDALLYSDRGALNFGQLHNTLTGRLNAPELLAVGLLIAGFATKAGLIPFHAWLPDAHTAPPGAVSALFSALMVDLGVVGIVRMVLLVFAGHGHALGLVMVLGVISAILGAVLALAQDDLKRLLAWDTVSQVGILMIGFATASAAGVAGAVYHLLNHALFKALLFLCAGTIVHAAGETQLSKMGGLARHRPLITTGFTVGVLAIAGIPPLNGYASLGLIHKSLQNSHQWVVLAAALLAQVVTIAALARAAWLAFYRSRDEAYEHLEPSRPGMRFTLIALGAGCLAFGTLPVIVIRRVVAPAAGLLLHPDLYSSGILAGHASLPSVTVAYSYLDPVDLAITAGTLLLGLGLAALYVRCPEPAPITVLRRVQSGSVNDYAAFSTVGVITCVTALLL
ncbi:MAG: Fe-S-binding domain-containing protein [Actinomycetota bacterium]|nr:Fe-S-binding domain-containing protein [Actinomycetota bacterium]